jgi:tRNA A-37 threonylcarbamoyl transferase component Bud32
MGLSAGLIAAYLMVIQLVYALASMALAVVIFLRRPENWMALLVSLVGATFATNIDAVFSLHALYPQWHLPIAIVLHVSQAVGITVAFLFPDGRFVPRWTAVLAIIVGGWMLVAMPFPTASFSPERLPPWLLFLLVLGCGGAAVYAQIYRYIFVSSPTQRQQTKWVLFGLVVVIVGFLGDAMLPTVLVPLQQPGPVRAVYSLLIGPAFRLLMLAGPVAIGVSILRYRLWDIDFIINRSLVYGSLTLLLVALFGGSLLAISQILWALTGGQQSMIALVLSAVLFGVLFQPASRRLQRLVDERFYGIQIDYREGGTPPVTVADDPVSPRIGKYGDLKLIGQGGMAEVYRAKDPDHNQVVAIKVLLQHILQEQELRVRFEREAQTVAGLMHPNIVQVSEYGEADGRYYMAMEYIEGPDLSEFLDQRGRLSLAQALPLVQDITDALDYAHRQGLVHRDIKPSNVMLRPSTATPMSDMPYQAVLMDFGIAKITGRSTQLTKTGILGTFNYIAPEQIRSTAEVDGRADVYALGILVYQMLVGELPFKQQQIGALLIAHLMQPPPDPCDLVPGLPRQIGRAVLRALAKDPDERYATAGEFAQEIKLGMM